MNVKVIVLTEGKDPAEIIVKDPELWKQAIKNSIGVVDFYIDAIFKRVDLSRADHKKLAAQKIVGIINKLKTKIEQAHYITLLAAKLQMQESILVSMVSAPEVKPEPMQEEMPRPESKKGSAFFSEHLLSFIIQYPDMGSMVMDDLEPEMLSPDIQDLYKKMIVQYTKSQLPNFLELSSELSPDELRRWSELVFQGERFYGSLLPEQRIHELERLRTLVIHAYYSAQLQDITEAIKRAEVIGDQNALETLLQAYHALSKKRASR
jgi:DNA primase